MAAPDAEDVVDLEGDCPDEEDWVVPKDEVFSAGYYSDLGMHSNYQRVVAASILSPFSCSDSVLKRNDTDVSLLRYTFFGKVSDVNMPVFWLQDNEFFPCFFVLIASELLSYLASKLFHLSFGCMKLGSYEA